MKNTSPSINSHLHVLSQWNKYRSKLSLSFRRQQEECEYKTRNFIVYGLPNHGQTCFLNSVLQALSSCNPFLQYLCDRIQYLEDVVFLQSHLQSKEALHEDKRMDEEDAVTNESKQRENRKDPVLDYIQLLLNTLWYIRGFSSQDIPMNHNLFLHQSTERILKHVAQTHVQFASSSPSSLWNATMPSWKNTSLFNFFTRNLSSFYTYQQQQDAQEALHAIFDSLVVSNYHRNPTMHQYCTTMNSLDPCPTTVTPLHALSKQCGTVHTLQDQNDDLVTLCSILIQMENERCIWRNRNHHKNPSMDKESCRNQMEIVNKDRDDANDDLNNNTMNQDTIIPTNGAHSNLSLSFSSYLKSQQRQEKQDQLQQRHDKRLLPVYGESPFTGWIGSFIECCSCHHRRPLRNQKFFDIPLIPTCILSPMIHQSSSVSSCTLEQCLQDFTQVEIITDVDCLNCAIQSEVQKLQNEIRILKDTIHYTTQNIQNTLTSSSSPQYPTQMEESRGMVQGIVALNRELDILEQRIHFLTCLDPDDDDMDNNNLYYTAKTKEKNNPVDSTTATRIRPDEDDILHDYMKEMNLSNAFWNMMPSDVHRLPKPKRCNAMKGLCISRPPVILCLHIKRVFYNVQYDQMTKTTQHVIFPEILVLDDVLLFGRNSQKTSEIQSVVVHGSIARYRLVSVIEHRGNAVTGHYVTYRRGSSSRNASRYLHQPREEESLQYVTTHSTTTHKEKDWAMISDEKVSYLSFEQVMKCQAYMLFYEKLDTI